VLCLLLMISSCEEDVYAPLAEESYPVVYCILSKNDTAHYVRLTKTFSGPVSAYAMAQNPDSLYYKNAKVLMELWDGIYIMKTLELEPTYEIPRDSGIFYSDSNLLYKTNYPLGGSVRLHIILPDKGTEIIGETVVMSSCSFESPDTTKSKVLSFFETESVLIQWSGVKNVCQTTFRMNYLESRNTGIDTCHLDWVRKSCDFSVIGADYLQFIQYWIKDDPKVNSRRFLSFDILYETGNSQMASYMKYKDWSIDVIEKPFSNLVNAYGLFASRVSGQITGLLSNQKFIDSLADSPLTRHLKFVTWTEE